MEIGKRSFLDSTSIFIILAIGLSIFLGYGIATISESQDSLNKAQRELIKNQKVMIENQKDIHALIDSIAKEDNIKIK